MQTDEGPDSDEDDDLPPLEANTNRNRVIDHMNCILTQTIVLIP